MAVVLSVATLDGCLMTMLSTTGGAAPYCPEGYCKVGFVWFNLQCLSECSNGHRK